MGIYQHFRVLCVVFSLIAVALGGYDEKDVFVAPEKTRPSRDRKRSRDDRMRDFDGRPEGFNPEDFEEDFRSRMDRRSYPSMNSHKSDVETLHALQTEATSLREMGKEDEALAVDAKIREQITVMHENMKNMERPELDDRSRSRRDSKYRDDIEASRFDDASRDEMLERMRSGMGDMDRDMPNFDELDPKFRDRMRDRMGEDRLRDMENKYQSRGPSDVVDRHKELVSHRIEKLTNRINKAGFSEEEAEELKSKLQENAELEYQVIASRTIDRHYDESGRPKSAQERLKLKEGMQERRQFERESMEKSRQDRKKLEDRIRERERETMSGRTDF